MRHLVRFALVGTLGFVVDAGLLWLIRSAVAIDPRAARLASFAVAVTVTWFCNSRFTFDAPLSARSWARYVAANSMGALFNYAVFAALVTLSAWFAGLPEAAVAVASVLALGVNFVASKYYALAPRPAP